MKRSLFSVLHDHRQDPTELGLRAKKRRIISLEQRWPEYIAGLRDFIAPFVRLGIPVRVRPLKLRKTCHAKTRRGTPCRSIAMKNGRCRLHGGKSTGPKSAEGWARTRAGYRAHVDQRRAARMEQARGDSN